MKTINLRKLYFPHYHKNVFVEVSDEVAEVLYRTDREMDNYRRRTCYHRAFYSLDAFDWTECYALAHNPSRRNCLFCGSRKPPAPVCVLCWAKHCPALRQRRPGVSVAITCKASISRLSPEQRESPQASPAVLSVPALTVCGRTTTACQTEVQPCRRST